MSENTIFAPTIKLNKINNINGTQELNKLIEEFKDYHDDQGSLSNTFYSITSYINNSSINWLSINNNEYLYDTMHNTLYFNIFKDLEGLKGFECRVSALRNLLNKTPYNDLFLWYLPSINQISRVTDVNKSPFLLLTGHDDNTTKLNLLINSGIWSNEDLKDNKGSYKLSFIGGIGHLKNKDNKKILLPISKFFEKYTIDEMVAYCLDNEWEVNPLDVDEQDSEYIKFKDNYNLIKNTILINKLSITIKSWQDLDFVSTRLPIIDKLRFTDINQGVWEFFAPDTLRDEYTEVSNPDQIRARNPELDIKNAKVAIDFGTSSTVVAIRSNGKDELLRVGLQAVDFKKDSITENDFENPTILEFLNINSLKDAWHSETYRPLVNWNDIHCSHEARNRLRQNDTDPIVVGSMLTRLKQWALHDHGQNNIRISDSLKQTEFEFEQLKDFIPTKGQPIQLNSDYPILDPIELYAWFLGMNINWRERGIFLKYFLTFPVDYPSDIKDKILASFRRGIERSLPKTLIYSEKFKDFEVTHLASEPAAFAAAAIDTLDIEPTEEGIAYSVFDFGGGTTDFDYGLYRFSNIDEEDEGWDYVLEHFGSSGDNFLGGENLIEHLVYLVFKLNKDVCRANDIIFSKPIDADPFVGSELLISTNQSAVTNTTILMSKLRPYWEDSLNQEDNDPLIKVRLLNRKHEKVECELAIDKKMIDQYLKHRLTVGIVSFCTAMNRAFTEHLGFLPKQIHILLAGNSSRSEIFYNLIQYLGAEYKRTLLIIKDIVQALNNIKNQLDNDDSSKVLDELDKIKTIELSLSEQEISNTHLKSLIKEIKDLINDINVTGDIYENIQSNDDESFKQLKDSFFNVEGTKFSANLKKITKILDSTMLFIKALGINNIEEMPEFTIHKPLRSDPNDPFKPNTKTGVALGLLKMTPGEVLKVVNHDLTETTESLFQYYVGTHRRGVFKVGIHRGEEYDQWVELGRVRQGVFPLLYTTSPQALNNMERGSSGLVEREIEFKGDIPKGAKVFGRIIGPDSIELCLSEGLKDIENQVFRIKVSLND